MSDLSSLRTEIDGLDDQIADLPYPRSTVSFRKWVAQLMQGS